MAVFPPSECPIRTRFSSDILRSVPAGHLQEQQSRTPDYAVIARDCEGRARKQYTVRRVYGNAHPIIRNTNNP